MLISDENDVNSLYIVMFNKGDDTIVDSKIIKSLSKEYSIAMNLSLYSDNKLYYHFKRDSEGVWALRGIEDYTADSLGYIDINFINNTAFFNDDIYIGDFYISLADFLSLENKPKGIAGFLKGKYNSQNYAVVSSLNPDAMIYLRPEPVKNNKYIAKYYNGVVVKVLEKLGTWIKVSVFGLEGYIRSEFLSFDVFPSKIHNYRSLAFNFDKYSNITIKDNVSYTHIVIPYYNISGFVQSQYLYPGNG